MREQRVDVGSTGHAITAMKPVGKVRIGSADLPAKAEGQWIEAGTDVVVVGFELSMAVVRDRRLAGDVVPSHHAPAPSEAPAHIPVEERQVARPITERRNALPFVGGLAVLVWLVMFALGKGCDAIFSYDAVTAQALEVPVTVVAVAAWVLANAYFSLCDLVDPRLMIGERQRRAWLGLLVVGAMTGSGFAIGWLLSQGGETAVLGALGAGAGCLLLYAASLSLIWVANMPRAAPYLLAFGIALGLVAGVGFAIGGERSWKEQFMVAAGPLALVLVLYYTVLFARSWTAMIDKLAAPDSQRRSDRRPEFLLTTAGLVGGVVAATWGYAEFGLAVGIAGAVVGPVVGVVVLLLLASLA